MSSSSTTSSSSSSPLLHIVCLRFKPELTEERIIQHFKEEVALTTRMPDLVASFTFHKNVSLEDRADVNGGCQWVVMSKLFRAEDLKAYLCHPEHVAVGVIQNPMLLGKFVVDVEVQ